MPPRPISGEVDQALPCLKYCGDFPESLLFSVSSWAKAENLSIMEYPSVEVIVTKYNKTTDHVLIRFLIHGKLVMIPKSVTPKHYLRSLRSFTSS